ncbi:unnamed protein product [marine sediment metagenome]|uniref:PD-(D/E)XK endonuclease-like domain-containing protein n=1 Tax=marine sediment metagenome TaxID=412755 RepID=X0ZQK8_9ZZZZ
MGRDFYDVIFLFSKANPNYNFLREKMKLKEKDDIKEIKKKLLLKYKFNYIDKIKREEEGIEAFLGSCFHEVMEKIYKDLPFRKYSLDELLAFYEDNWDKKYHDKIIIADNEREAKDYKEIGKKFIEDYYKRYYPFNQGKVLGIERWVIINLDDKGEYKLKGIIDRLDQTKDGTYEIHDYKTSKSLPEQSKMDEDRQLALYQIGVQSMWNDVGSVELVWHYVTFDKEIRSKRTEEELDEGSHYSICRKYRGRSGGRK